jgi:hypothetical protein
LRASRLAPAPSRRAPAVFIDRYAEIAEYKKREAEAEAEAYKVKIREERALQKLQLDEQVRLKRERLAREKADETKFIDFETERRERWNAVDASKRQDMKEKELAQRLAREAQVRDVHARKASQARVEAQSQLDILGRIREELAHERVVRAAHKMQEAQNMRSVSAQNAKHLEMAAERRHQQFLDGQKVRARVREERRGKRESARLSPAIPSAFLLISFGADARRAAARAHALPPAPAR